MVSLPGAYPLDDSAPATPEELPQGHHSHHTRNKLHKPQDPRGHYQKDSGVGGIGPAEQEPERIQPSSHPRAVESEAIHSTAPPPVSHQETQGPQAANDFLDVTGGDYYTFTPAKPPIPVESGPIHSSGQPEPHPDTYTRETQSSEQPGTTQTDRFSSSKSDTGSAQQNDNPDAPPYWGDLPKGQRGGIYNTVTGHGSPSDDHNQHHHIPDRQRSQRGHVAGTLGTDQTSSGVYNTIAGHGSQDEESKRHNLASSREGATIASTEAVHDAPLAGIPENKPLSSTTIPSGDLGMGFLPETAAGDDARLLSRAQRAPEMAPPHTSQLAAASHPSSTAPKSDTMHRRAFPLGPSKMQSDVDAMKSHSNDQHNALPGEEDTRQSRQRNPVFAGTAAAGTGIAASELVDRHESKRARSTSEHRDGRNRLSKFDRKGKDSGSSGSDYSSGKEKHKERRKSSGDNSAKGEKMHHKILGMFGLHKDEKDMEDTSTTEPSKERTPHHPGDKKKDAAVAAAAGAGGIGLMKRHKDDHKPKEQEAVPDQKHHEHHGPHEKKTGPKPEPRLFKDPAQPLTGTNQGLAKSDQPAATLSGPFQGQPHISETGNTDRSRAAPIAAAGLGAAAGVGAYQASRKHGDPTQDLPPAAHPEPTIGRSYAFENPRAPPTNPATSEHHAQPTRTNAGMMSSTSRQQPVVTHQPGNYSTLSSGTASGVATNAPPHQPSGQQSRKYDTLASGTASGVKPKDRPVEGAVTHKPGDYNTPSSGTESGVKSHFHEGLATSNSSKAGGDYNTLQSGTASGVATDTTPTRAKSDKESHGSSSGGAYNVLASGTPSGVKVEPRKHRSSEDRGSHMKSSGYNTLASGTTSGINTEARPNQVPIGSASTSGNRDLPDRLGPPPIPTGKQQQQQQETKKDNQGNDNNHASPGFVSVPITARHSRTHDHHPQTTKTSQESTDDQARHMSPEVMPSAYTTSAPRAGKLGQPSFATRDYPATTQQAKGMSPEVMPPSYTSSAPRPAHVPDSSSSAYQSGEYPTAHSHTSDINPALAAATGAWASSSSGGGGGGQPTVVGGSGWPLTHRGPGGKTVIHKCQHCGGENDITEYLMSEQSQQMI